ncbi:hypothetical protein PtA15_13A23 [Puccinia triticina]|uniref:DFDF domain-containing protein n=1 Tax=Puccinia triticina TaxID=208348 RepID=A0ABY7D069_9BASI|nr:uncharacterized protein PtA15_13A23 [Puccinia triticina]WAQ90625.1 hypothetical protein PtA15_13A23 [Puccinia triticina]WAR60781.1 hypothetical protein PtB15_13B25 [Puccinia triticina]
MVESTRAAAKSNMKNASKTSATSKDRQEDQVATGDGRGDVEATETLTDARYNIAPGTEPVDKSTGAELDFEEDDIVESNLKGHTPGGDEAKFVDLIRAVPNPDKSNSDANSILIEQALQALNAGNASVASVLMKAANEIKSTKSKLFGSESTIEDTQDGGLMLNLQANNFHNVSNPAHNQSQGFNGQGPSQAAQGSSNSFNTQQNNPMNQHGNNHESKKRARSGYKGSNFIQGFNEKRASSNPPPASIQK